ncbi:MAG: hypothetical protein DRJ01_15455 [Bacteroidetes bacterium]|nr:MAG: hypothetical protein DRJ01_15455 [Bacteroidota bacterium]
MLEVKTRIKIIREELDNLGLMLPGSISKQWYRCGKKGCKCMDSENPQKHGPYYQLSYTLAGKSSSMLIKKEFLSQANQYISNYRCFKELNKKLLEANIDFIRLKGFSTKDGNY